MGICVNKSLLSRQSFNFTLSVVGQLCVEQTDKQKSFITIRLEPIK